MTQTTSPHAEFIDTTDITCSEVNLRGLSSAFALIACADAELASSEIDRFRELIHDVRACQGFDLDELEREFLSLSNAILQDFGAGRHRALEAIMQVRGDAPATARVMAAAQAAIVADGQLHEVEEAVLADICRALEVDPSEY